MGRAVTGASVGWKRLAIWDTLDAAVGRCRTPGTAVAVGWPRIWKRENTVIETFLGSLASVNVGVVCRFYQFIEVSVADWRTVEKNVRIDAIISQ